MEKIASDHDDIFRLLWHLNERQRSKKTGVMYVIVAYKIEADEKKTSDGHEQTDWRFIYI